MAQGAQNDQDGNVRVRLPAGATPAEALGRIAMAAGSCPEGAKLAATSSDKGGVTLVFRPAPKRG